MKKRLTPLTVWIAPTQAQQLRTLARRHSSTRHRLIQQLLRDEIHRNRKRFTS